MLCVDSLEAALALKGPGRVIAGERHCLRPPGFDLGNSPADTDPPHGTELVLATTNGAPAIVGAALLAPTVLIACLRNLAAVAAAVSGADVLVLCSGTDEHPSLEDTFVAGRLVETIGGAPTDAALIARAISRAYPALEALSAGAGGRALTEVGLDADIAFCAQESVVTVAGAVTTVSGGVAQWKSFVELRAEIGLGSGSSRRRSVAR